MNHHPDCDVNDINPDGIKKPCNCGLDSLTAQLEEARGDRERLDWLSAASMAGALIIATDVTQCYLSQASVPTYAPTLRQAIDAAMQQKDVLEPKQ
jgi:hypothetical protein